MYVKFWNLPIDADFDEFVLIPEFVAGGNIVLNKN